MHFVTAGSGKPALVFVHGFGCSHEDWEAQLQGLAHHHQVAACDLRGHGATPGQPHECSIEHYGGDVAALVAHLGLSDCILVGHSMGCRVVLEAARLDPERIAGLVLIEGSRQALGDPEAAERGARALLAARGYENFMRPFFQAMFLSQGPQSEAAVERALRLPAETGTALFARMARWDAGRMEAALDAVRAPVMAIQSTYVDTERRRVPLQAGASTPWLDLVKEKVPAASIAVLPGLGHFPQTEAPERVNDLIGRFAGAPGRFTA